MSTSANWATLEGGQSQTFPLSINQATEWTSLRRGECYSQDNTDFERGGVLAFAEPPPASTKFFNKPFIVSDGAEYDGAAQASVTRYWAYGRWWRISLTTSTPYRLEYSDFGQEQAATFILAGYLDFNEDGNDRISLIAPAGDGAWFILKPTCGYLLTNANGDATSFRKTAAHYGVGCSNPGSSVSNCVIAGNIAAAWTGDDGRVKHWLWDGSKDGGVELSRNVRDLAALQKNTTTAQISWAHNLVICGGLVYDLDNKRVFYYSGNGSASVVTRPYFHVHYRPIMLSKLAFFCNGKSGRFTCVVEYGQAPDSLAQSKSFTVEVTPTTRNRFRHVWTLDRSIRCRVYRIKIADLVGVGISQIDAFSSVDDSPDAYDGEQ